MGEAFLLSGSNDLFFYTTSLLLESVSSQLAMTVVG
jgi:hypothetical protein